MRKTLIVLSLILAVALCGCGQKDDLDSTEPTMEKKEVNLDETGLISDYMSYFTPEGYEELPDADKDFLKGGNMIASSEFTKKGSNNEIGFHVYVYKAGTSEADEAIGEKEDSENKVKKITIGGKEGFSAVNKERKYNIVVLESGNYVYSFFCPLNNSPNKNRFDEFLKMVQFSR